MLPGLILFQVTAVGLAAWVASGDPVWIFLAGPAVVAGLWRVGTRDRVPVVAGLLLLAGVVAVLAGEYHLHRLAQNWSERSVQHEIETQERLAEALDALVLDAENAVARLATDWADGRIADPPHLPSGRTAPGVDALALFDSQGELIAWEGPHRGTFPVEVRGGEAPYFFREGALFGYLYLTRPLPGGEGTAVAASLLRSDLPPALGSPAGDFEARFEARTGARIDITRADRALGDRIWDWRWEEEVLFSVSLAAASEAEARSARALLWERIVTFLLVSGWLLTLVGARGHPAGVTAGAAALPILLLLLPLGRITAWGRAFSPADFLLPGPLALTLGDLVAVGAAGVIALGLLPWSRLPRVPGPLAVLGGIGLAVGSLLLLEAGASRNFLAGEDLGWVILQGVAATFVLLAFGVAVLLSGRREAEPGGAVVRPVGLVLSLATGFALALGWIFGVGGSPGMTGWAMLLWAIPLWGLAWSLTAMGGWSAGVARWACVGALSVTLALPWAWELRVDARMAVAEERVDRLGTRPDPFLEFLLLRVGEEAWSLAERGADPVEILYGAWVQSGLAWEGIPLWITYWSPEGEAQEELRIGVAENRPPVPASLLQAAWEDGRVVVQRFDLAETHYLGAAPLPDDGLVSVAVPPRRMLATESPLGPLFSPARSEPDPLVLVPLLPGEAPGPTEGVRWVRTRDGWQGETYLAYPDEVYHAHYLLDLPDWFLLLARGTLLLLLNIGVLGVLWVGGRWLGVGPPGRVGAVLGALHSFRGRVTLALFGFFLIPSIAFGTMAYRTLSGAAVRTAEALAERAVEDAATWYSEVDGAMDMLARRVGSDLLLYERGGLVAGSLPELVALGLYEGWVPPGIHRDMIDGEELMATSMANLGGWEYVVAYRRMPGDRVLAAPAPLQAGATALRQRDVTDLIAFAVVLGGILSILLALLVGRALTRPIQTLRIASERVGAGNMEAHLPGDRTDEFGAVFEAFNRMVDRLAQTRAALLRTSRRTRAIVEEVATGVVALDSGARITLANSRAETLLGVSLHRGRPLSNDGDPESPGAAFAAWVSNYFRDGLREAGTELSIEDRRIRVKARRIARKGPMGGAVLSLEDVTDELRTERVLAWGEMAQQVAHEVKNPLTPIKLGVQHIRRAWEDGRPDYQDILRRNVDAILEEIERLASVASSFSRYAAPSPAGAEPLEPVEVEAVVQDVLDLYAAGGGPVTFEFELEGGDEVPPVTARTGELKEVLVNLLENSRAALPGGGRVSVEVRSLDGEVELIVSDDGTGIPPELLSRIFEPQFSTRSSGTGLGLAIVRRLVESWGGRVAAESRQGEGTTMRIHLVPWSERLTHAPSGSGGRGGVADPDS